MKRGREHFTLGLILTLLTGCAGFGVTPPENPEWKLVGVIIESIEPGSAAERAGLQPGDRIRSIGNRTITSEREFWALLEDGYNTGLGVAVLVYRPGVCEGKARWECRELWFVAMTDSTSPRFGIATKPTER